LRDDLVADDGDDAIGLQRFDRRSAGWRTEESGKGAGNYE
jgi:hypothetical protein